MTDLGLFAMGLLMLFGQIILVTMFQHGWFKKENFKIQKSQIMAENKLRMRKLEKEFGLQKTPSNQLVEHETPSLLSNIGALLPLIKNLDTEQLGDLVDMFVNRGYASEEEVKSSPVDWVMDFAQKNPDLAKGFIEGITQKATGGQQGMIYEG